MQYVKHSKVFFRLNPVIDVSFFFLTLRNLIFILLCMFANLFQPKNIENFSLVEQKRIILTSKIAIIGAAVLLFYIPFTAILKRYEFLFAIIFTFLNFILVIALNNRNKHFLAKFLLCFEPIIHIFFVELTQGNSVHLYNIVIIFVPFIVFDFKKERQYSIALAILNFISIAFCQLVVFYPELNPFAKEPPIWWFEYLDWVTAPITTLALVLVISNTNSQNEQKLLQINEQAKILTDELQQTVQNLILSENTLEKQKSELEKLNQELASREEELRQNLEELQATQESLIKEKQIVQDLNKSLMIREIELKQNVEELTYMQEQAQAQNKLLIDARKKMEMQNQELITREEELKQNLEELHTTQEQMRLAQQEAERNAMNANKIFEAAPVGLFISKVSNRTIVQANQAMAKLLKIPTYEIIGRTTLSFYASEEQAKTVFSKLMQSGRFDDEEIDLKLDDGSVITVLVSAQTMTLNNEKVIVAGLNDITALKKAQAELSDLAQNLSKKVEEQTEEIKRSFAQMVQNEKMAALGQLVAGVAHEINTPIGAIKASAENMQENLPSITHQFLHGEIPISFTTVFEKAVNHILYEKTSLSSREERAYRKQITEILEQNNIENASEIAFSLVQIGLVKDIEFLIPVFQSENYQSMLELLSRIGKLKLNIDTILVASNKTKKIVSALKAYTHRQMETLTPTNINESIETVLILYHNQIKHGVEVITDFAELPMIDCYSDELGQVWTNLIVNALQAMEYKGKLTITTKVQDKNILVAINDNGPGIPPEIQSKIFEPFFTTKVQGEGTGLGLDICKKIIEKHNGKMFFTSEPGNTTFYISLPIHQTANAQ